MLNCSLKDLIEEDRELFGISDFQMRGFIGTLNISLFVAPQDYFVTHWWGQGMFRYRADLPELVWRQAMQLMEAYDPFLQAVIIGHIVENRDYEVFLISL